MMRVKETSRVWARARVAVPSVWLFTVLVLAATLLQLRLYVVGVLSFGVVGAVGLARQPREVMSRSLV